jgi:hypothetical protein
LALNAAKVIRQLPQLANQIFSSLLDALLFCYDDPLSDIAAAAVEALNSLSIEPSRLGDALRKKLSGLPLLARSSSVDDAAKVVAFRILLSLTRAMAVQPGALELVLDLHLEDISTSLLPLYGIDERASALPEVEPTGLEYPRKEYISFHDPKLAVYARDFVRSLGALGPSMALVDHYLSYCASRTMRPAALLIIADLLAGAGVRLASETRAQVRQELRVLSDAWVVDLSALFPLACYAMEALGALVSVSDADEIKREVLPSFLYPLLEQLGNGQASAAYAHVTLTRLARATSTASTGALLAANADYLIDELALRLRSLDANPGVPSVLMALFRHCPAMPFALLDDTLDLILRALDTQHRRPEAAGQLLNVLQALIRLIASNMPERPAPAPPGPPSPPPVMEPAEKHETSPDEVREFFMKIAEEKEKAKELKGVDFDAPPAARLPDEGDGGGDLQPSREETALLKCVEKTRHFVSRQETAVAQASLAVQLTALPHLWRMQGAVLPTIFGLWQPLVSRIRAADGAPDVLQGVLHTVTALVRGVPDFLLPKFNTELLPALTALLRRYQAADPITSVSELSPAFRLQLAALQCLTQVLASLTAAPSVRPAFDQIGDVCAPYLEAGKPAALQEAAMDLYKRIVAVDPDALWLQLMTWAGVSPPAPPPGCKPIVLALPATRHPAAENAGILLRLMEVGEAGSAESRCA